MRPVMHATRVAVTLLVSMMAIASPAPRPAWTAPLEPMTAGWEGIFSLDWQVSERRGQPVLQGYVANRSPYSVTSIQLLVEALDARGEVVGQRVAWAGAGDLGPFSRVYFQAPAPREASSTYRVRVFSFDRFETSRL